MKKLFSVLILCLCLTACAKEPGNMTDGTGSEKTLKVGIVQFTQHEALDAATEGFLETLESEFGNQIEVLVKNASGDYATCSAIVNGFITDGVDLIMANATPAVKAAAAATDSIPILGTSVTDYGAALEIDDFNGVTGMNVSGTSDLAPLDVQAQMILDLFPETETVGIIFCSNEANSRYQVKVVEEYLKGQGITVETASFTDSNDVAPITEDLCSRIDVLYIPTDNKAAECADTIGNIVLEKKIPVISGEEGVCRRCGVATLTISYRKLGNETGKMAISVLKEGTDVAALPIRYYPEPVKKFNPEICELLNVDIPEGFEPVE